jgi:hypothetical protein
MKGNSTNTTIAQNSLENNQSNGSMSSSSTGILRSSTSYNRNSPKPKVAEGDKRISFADDHGTELTEVCSIIQSTLLF